MKQGGDRFSGVFRPSSERRDMRGEEVSVVTLCLAAALLWGIMHMKHIARDIVTERDTHMCMHTYIYSLHTYTDMHTCTPTNTRTHTHTYTHTHTHNQTVPISPYFVFLCSMFMYQ